MDTKEAGRRGGKARAAKLSPKRRTEIARAAGRARQQKARLEPIICGVCGKDDHETEDCQHSN